MKDYNDFIQNKQFEDVNSGFNIADKELNNDLFPFQKAIVKWALLRGRAAIFADTGLGKTLMQLEWADKVVNKTKKNILILAPLCVSHQTIREGEKFGISVNYCRNQDQIVDGINITNYEMLDHFNLSKFVGIILDESSIIKHQSSKIRNKLIKTCVKIPYRLSCTATPSPNDFMELGNQSEFLGIMKHEEMLAMFFIHDGSDTSKWRLKGHGREKFWAWMATWSVCIRKPSDIGFSDDKYNLPKMSFIEHVVETEPPKGHLFAMPAEGLIDRNRARKHSVNNRVKICADIVNKSSGKFIIWCHLNDESAKLVSAIPGAKDVKGSDSIERKENIIDDFTSGSLRVLVTKPSISGFGMNWQHCNNMAFVCRLKPS